MFIGFVPDDDDVVYVQIKDVFERGKKISPGPESLQKQCHLSVNPYLVKNL